MPDRPTPATWRDQAVCTGLDPELFFAEKGDNLTIATAKAVCRTCPVQPECLDYAMRNNELHGIWGGLSRRERIGLRRRRRRAA